MALESPGEAHKLGVADLTRQCAEFLGWNYDKLKGSARLVQKLVDGEWDEQEFLVVEPGRKIRADVTSPGIIRTA